MPAFVYKWLKATSATGHMRSADRPNLRVQDGPTRPWLCTDCEARFNKYETQFAKQLFHPFGENPASRLLYGRWLLKFCVSVSWRQVLLQLEDGVLENVKPELLDATKAALQSWAAFLLDESPHPGRFEQHLLPLGAIEEHSIADMPENFNRYSLRTVSMNVISVGAKTMLSVCKLGPLVVVGFIKVEAPKEWRGTKVHVVHGTVQPGRYKVPQLVLEYLLKGARGFRDASRKISEAQLAKIGECVERDPGRVANSSSFKAMLHDIELFGDQAFGAIER